MKISSHSIKALLKQKPGLTASASPFINFLNNRHNLNVHLPSYSKQNHQVQEKEIVSQVKVLINRLDSTTSYSETRALIAATISKLYQINLKRILSLKWSDVSISNSIITLTVDDGHIDLHPRISDIFIGWSHGNHPLVGYVFEGRNPAQPLSCEAIKYFERIGSQT